MLSEDRFDGKVVLITGAGRGVGRAVAEAFAGLGACLALNDITPINLDVTMQRVRALGAPAQDYIGDMGKQMLVESLVDRALTDWGRIDALVYCAGVRPRAALYALDEWDWRHTLDVNLSGPFFALQIAGRAMQRQGGGAVVFFGAVGAAHAGTQAALGSGSGVIEYGAAFAASKMGLIGLTQHAARELAADRIRVNAIDPGPWSLAGDEPAAAARLEKVVQTVLYLCGSAAENVTGQVVSIA